MKFKRIITAMMMVILLCTVITICTPDSQAYSYIGKCGENISYYHLGDNTLYITGSGAMYNYSASNPAPWKEVASSITKVSISGGVTSIGNYAFADCKNLKTISDGSGVTSVGAHAFDGCSSLGKVPFGSVAIGDYAFRNCSSLTSVSVAGDTLPEGAFSGCTSLSSVSLGNGITVIPDNAFYNCSSLATITMPENLTAIGASAFEGCSSLDGIMIPDSISSIGVNAFKGCTSMVSFSIPAGVKKLEEGVLAGCTSLGSVAIHEDLVSLGKEAFAGCSSLLAIVLPDTLNEIGEGVFSGCSSLTSISLPDGIKSIPNNAFYECAAIKNIELSTNVESIGADAFNGCSSLLEITLNEGITEIGNNAFNGCTSLTSCVLPSSIDIIGDSAFNGCTSLNSIKFMGYLTKWDEVTVGADNPLLSAEKIETEYIDGGNIGNGIYWSVSNAGCLIISGKGKMSDFVMNDTPWIKYNDIITSIAIDDNITDIGVYAFSGLTNLKEVLLPKGVTKISKGTFFGCTSLESVIGLENILTIGESAFENCTSLVVNNITSHTLNARAFAGCTSIEKMIISGVVIGKEAFDGCTGLKTIIIKNTITEIGIKAFNDCPLVSANYTGTEEELDELYIGSGNDALKDVIGIYYYIRNIYVGRGVNKKEAMASVEEKSDGILELDIDSSDSKYVCLGYSLTNDPEEALTGIVLYSTNEAEVDGSVEFDGITYYLISTPVSAVAAGNTIYLCTTKDINAGDPVYMIGLLNNSNNKGTFKDGESWERASEVNGNISTFNGTANGISLYYTKDLSADINAPISVWSIIIIGVICICLISGGVGVWIYLKKSSRNRKEKPTKLNADKEEFKEYVYTNED